MCSLSRVPAPTWLLMLALTGCGEIAAPRSNEFAEEQAAFDFVMQAGCKVPISIGGVFSVTGTPANNRYEAPSVAYNDGDNEYMVVWVDDRNAANNGDVFGRRVAADGTPLGPEIPIFEFADAQLQPRIAYNTIDNEYLALWQTQQSGAFGDVYGRRLSTMGALLGNEFYILATDIPPYQGTAYESSIAFNTTHDEYLVTGRGIGIRGRLVSGAGALLGPEIPIAPYFGPGPNGQVAYNPNTDEYLATWRDGVFQDLRGQIITAGGGLRGNVISISPLFTETGHPWAAGVAFDPRNDRYLVVFGIYQGDEIWGQFLASSGSLIGPAFRIAGNQASRVEPLIVYDDTLGMFLIVWQNGSDLLAQFVSDSGVVLGTPLRVASLNRITIAAAGGIAVARNNRADEFLIVWTDVNVTGNPVLARRIGVADCPSSGGVLADPFGDNLYQQDLGDSRFGWGTTDRTERRFTVTSEFRGAGSYSLDLRWMAPDLNVQRSVWVRVDCTAAGCVQRLVEPASMKDRITVTGTVADDGDRLSGTVAWSVTLNATAVEFRIVAGKGGKWSDFAPDTGLQPARKGVAPEGP